MTITTSTLTPFSQLPPLPTAPSAGSSSPGSSSTQVPPPATDALGNEQTFLKLLVAQIRNQDPLNPADSLQYVTQLAQFSQLEQSLAMRQDLDAIKQVLAPPSPPPSTTTP
jgi:flagellar basal-body rod modification protein FlgD